MYAYLRKLITRGTTRLIFAEAAEERKIRVLEDQPNERFTLIIALMIVFFAG